MAASSKLEDWTERDDLVLETAETLLQMAETAKDNSTDKELKVFFSHLRSQCLRISDQMRRARKSSVKLGRQLISDTLNQFNSLIPTEGVHEHLKQHETIEFRLGTLNLHWKEARRRDAEAKRLFVDLWLAVQSSHASLSKLDDALEASADLFDSSLPEDSSRGIAEKFASTDMGEPPYVVCKAAQSVFDAFRECKECACPKHHQFGAKLELGTYRRPEKTVDRVQVSNSLQARQRKKLRKTDSEGADLLDLDLFLSADQEWHEFRVQTEKQKGVMFVLPGEEAPKACQVPKGHVKVERLCSPISKTGNYPQQRFILELTNGELFELGFEKSSFHIDRTAEPISLSRCLEERKDYFTEKTRRILSLIIGHTVLHLNGTSWLQPGWGSANIKFFQTTALKTPLRPFLQIMLPEPSLELAKQCPSPDIDANDLDDLETVHRCPTLVTLAVVLMEIYFVMPFRRLATLKDIQLIEASGGVFNIIDVDQVFNGVINDDDEVETDGWRKEMPDDSPLRVAIDNCLNPGLWEDENGQALNDGEIRSRIYEHVVSYLEQFLIRGYSSIPLDNVDKYARELDFGNWGQPISIQGQQNLVSQVAGGPLVAPPQTVVLIPEGAAGTHRAGNEYWAPMHQYLQVQAASVSHIQAATEPVVNYKAIQFFDDEIGEESRCVPEIAKYKAWRAEYDKAYSKFIGDYLTYPYHPQIPVKIAILDTGVDGNHDLIFGRYEKIKGRRNCYTQSQKSTGDQNGHGTFTASLIMDYAPDAHLYILKVSGKDNKRPDAKVVADAINHAVDTWNVDVISMSFGWPSSDFDGKKELEAAIDKAYNKRALMFAAAANSGGRLGRAYPASNPHVICVHSTNTNGNRSDFSPTAEPESVNIATVGEYVESAWPVHLCGDSDRGYVKTRSGTSYATPIMAGMAAFLLQYVRLNLSEKAEELKKKDMMVALLKRCAEKGPSTGQRDGYYYVSMSLHQQTLFGEEPEWVKREVLRVLKW